MRLLIFPVLWIGIVAGYSPMKQMLDPHSNIDYIMDKRSPRHENKEILTECIEMRSEAGIYQVKGTGEQLACGIFFVGSTDSQVEVEFATFDVSCTDGGVVAVLDGWEQNGSIFPPVQDLGTEGLRHESYCGANRPKHVFRSTGNMVLIQYRLPEPGFGFIVRISFPKNPRPCNAVAYLPEGKLMLRNYGLAVNCSIMMMYPEKFTFSYLDVGVSERNGGRFIPLSRPTTDCHPKDNKDYMELRGGSSFDLNGMDTFKQFCGFSAFSTDSYGVLCGTTMVRLVSSGHYDNSVLIDHELLEEDGIDVDTNICPVATTESEEVA